PPPSTGAWDEGPGSFVASRDPRRRTDAVLIRGTIRGTRQRFAFLAPDEGGEDLFIAPGNLGGAIHGDRVEVSLHRSGPYDFRAEAVVERILERPDPIFTGNVVRLARTAFVVPDSPVLPSRLRLKTGRHPAPEGSKILFRVEEPRPGRPPTAILERLLGEGDDPTLDATVVATMFRLPSRFPEEVLEEAVEAAAREPADGEAASPRTDYTDRFVLTIDPIDAKDFDDAISIRRDGDGFQLDVHIADVSALVPEGGAVDEEAARRGTSVYFPGSVIPMLPEALSSDAASLVPGRRRNVLTVEIEIDSEGAVRASRLREGFIESAARLHYAQAQRILDGKEGAPELRETLDAMAEAEDLLRRRRFRSGGFELELPETEMRLDARGMPTRIWRHRTLESNRLIEEFMILANRVVGRTMVDAGLPLLFRIHGEPDPVALERFAEVALTLVPGARSRDLETIPALRRFLTGLAPGPLTRIVHFFFLRSMKKAVYSPIDLGHFGLGIEAYCHFTSPIRRYPDLFNHRVVRWWIRNHRSGRARERLIERWEGRSIALAAETTRTEKNAEAAEREIVRIKSLRWAEEHLGETFAGRVVGMIPAGLFVELEKVPIEGFVPREGLRHGARYEEERLAFVDRRSRFAMRLGDRIEVQIARVDVRDRHLDFVWRGGAVKGPPRKERAKPKGRKRASRKRLRDRAGDEDRPRTRVKPGGRRADSKKGRKSPKPRRRPGNRRGGGR
ncbi:MAG: VacB/RNase II family 3'-5' exoribonuclease, partial [Candidatus Eisenbacteria bacterium]|nr:VacB/RNase II family 3'-5' exoribonuclease [Candidatus Latescibacterota bacterium]MBD3302391.1 VacB/RNase II family 3'-5' exoribonuclease [Candidatus Eisenbacteria bacterium]